MQVIYEQKLNRKDEAPIQQYELINTKRKTTEVRTNYGKQKFNYQVPSVPNIFNEHYDFLVSFHRYKSEIKEHAHSQLNRFWKAKNFWTSVMSDFYTEPMPNALVPASLFLPFRFSVSACLNRSLCPNNKTSVLFVTLWRVSYLL